MSIIPVANAVTKGNIPMLVAPSATNTGKMADTAYLCSMARQLALCFLVEMSICYDYIRSIYSVHTSNIYQFYVFTWSSFP